MTVDPTHLRPVEAVRALNSTPLGEVIDARRLRQHMDRAGHRIGDGRTIDLLRYTGWLCQEHHAQYDSASSDDRDAYARKRDAMADQSRAESKSGRDIGKIPPVANKQRRDDAMRSFRVFCETYFKHSFSMEWSPDHLIVIRKIEQSVLHGGLFAQAMPRGSGKTTLAEVACIWAILLGVRKFVALIGSSEPHADEMITAIRSELETNDLLAEDFPEVCAPICALEGISQRAVGQLCNGKRTHIEWGNKVVVLPTIDGSIASGAIIKTAGITGRVRGMKHKLPGGAPVRPDLAVIDDPQTDESARSISQCRERERIVAGAVLGLAGPGKKISGIMPLTVIRPDDMADRILDRQKHPEWNGERMKMVYAFPTNEALWEQYAETRRNDMRNGGSGAVATEFYRKNRAKMDAGAKVAWPARFNLDELSAVQNAMNLRIDRGDSVFFAEYQNEPIPDEIATSEQLSADDVLRRLNGRKRREVPNSCTTLTAFIDVQDSALYWMVVAWEPTFGGFVIDYGTWPDQKRDYFVHRDVKRSLASATPKAAGFEGQLYAGLESLVGEMVQREYRRQDGTVARISRCPIDANDGDHTETVFQFCRQTQHGSIVIPSHSKYYGAAGTMWHQVKGQKGDRMGLHWKIPAGRGRREVRYTIWDANWWKTFTAKRLLTAIGDTGALTLWGTKGEPHQMLAEHLTAERPIRVAAKGRECDEWKPKRPGLDNHWWDCLVGAAMAASMEGCVLPSVGGEHKPVRKRVSFAEMQRRARR